MRAARQFVEGNVQHGWLLPSGKGFRTQIRFGSPNEQDTFEAHGEPLGKDEVRLTKRAWPEDAELRVPEEAGNDQGVAPDVVMAICRDVPTLETLAAVSIVPEHLPDVNDTAFARLRIWPAKPL